MAITECPGCRGVDLDPTPSAKPGFYSWVNGPLPQIRSVTCLDCGLISYYQLDQSIAVLRQRAGLKPRASDPGDEI